MIKKLLTLFVAVAVVFSICSFAFVVDASAATTTTVAIRQEDTAFDGVKKLVFKMTTPGDTSNVAMFIATFSWDNDAIIPIDTYDGTTEYASLDGTTATYPFKSITVGRNTFNLSAKAPIVSGGRSAMSIVTSNPSPTTVACDASQGIDILEFWFKIKDESKMNINTFKLEDDASEGSILSQIYTVKSERVALYTQTNSAKSYYPSQESLDVAGFEGWTYTGSTIDPNAAVNTSWSYDTDGGYYYDSSDEKVGVIRFLFNIEADATITESGIKYIKASDITADLDDYNGFVGSSSTGTATTFYGDITDITESKANEQFYAVAYVIANGKTYWSAPTYCVPNFDKLIEY